MCEVLSHLGDDARAAAERRSRVKGRDDVARRESVGRAAALRDPVGRREKRSHREVPERNHHLRGDHAYLTVKETTTRIDLVGERVPVCWWPALHDVRDVAVGARASELLFDQLVEQLSGSTDEGLAGKILISSWSLADDHQIGVRASRREHDCRPGLGKPASDAGLRFYAKSPEIKVSHGRAWGADMPISSY